MIKCGISGDSEVFLLHLTAGRMRMLPLRFYSAENLDIKNVLGMLIHGHIYLYTHELIW